MKKILSALIFCVMIFSANCQAVDYRQEPLTILKYIVGNWYDTNGDLILTISNDYKLNGCDITQVLYTADSAALYKIFFSEGNQSKYIEVIYSGQDYHEMLAITRNSWSKDYALRRTKNPRYFESVGGIYLGMSENDILKLYGNHSSKENFNRFKKAWIWKYTNIGLDVSFYGGIVTEITVYSYGDRKFDWSGLSAKSSKNDFIKKYNATMYGRGGLSIGHGEVIYINDNKVTLTDTW